jgi:RNA polymerase sigma factor (sigma-70 family)
MDGVVRQVRRLALGRDGGDVTDGELLRRFVAQRDEAAFAALVHRYGPLVLGVCRRVLHHRQDAEDAFQATFLVLMHKAGSITRPELVGNWLYGVAYHTARNARVSATRRRLREREVGEMGRPQPVTDEAAGRELRAILDEELSALPEKYRVPVVLCELHGKGRREVARHLGCAEGTLSSRLARARQLLRRRLARRGAGLSAGALAATLSRDAASAAVPATLSAATVQTVMLAAASAAPAAVVPAQVAALTETALKSLFLARLKTTTLAALAVGLVGAALLGHRILAAEADAPAAPPERPAAKATATPSRPTAAPAGEADAGLVVSGHVLDPAGKPLPGANVRLFYRPGHAWSYAERSQPTSVTATAGPDGSFRLTAPKVHFVQEHQAVVVAAARGFGPAWTDVGAQNQARGFSLRLATDDVPVTGRVVDLQRRPVRGAIIRMSQLRASPREDLAPWVAAVKEKAGTSLRLEPQYLSRRLPWAQVPAQARAAVTDADGRFRLTGLGRERLVTVRLDGPTIASQEVRILTRPGRPMQVPATEWGPEAGRPVETLYYPATFELVAGPTCPVVGVVRDRDTGKPLAGATVQSYRIANAPLADQGFVRTTTDAAGHYRLVGLPKGAGNQIMVGPPDDRPYLVVAAKVPDPPAIATVTVDFRLKRAIWIEGRLTDKATGKPVQGMVTYFAGAHNTRVGEYAGYEGPINNRLVSNVREDGTFRVAGLPGPGYLAVWSSDRYLTVYERNDADGTRDNATRTAPVRVSTEGMNALAAIDPPPGRAAFRRNVTLDPGDTLRGTVLGPDGKPLAGVRTLGLSGWVGWSRPLETASFTVSAFNPRRPRRVYFVHPARHLAAVLDLSRDGHTPLTVRLAPGAAVTGRLVDADRQPQANVRLSVAFRFHWGPFSYLIVGYFPGEVRTDRDGRFRVDGLLPGQQFQLYEGSADLRSFTDLRAGQTKDLGDLLQKP